MYVYTLVNRLYDVIELWHQLRHQLRHPTDSLHCLCLMDVFIVARAYSNCQEIIGQSVFRSGGNITYTNLSTLPIRWKQWNWDWSSWKKVSWHVGRKLVEMCPSDSKFNRVDNPMCVLVNKECEEMWPSVCTGVRQGFPTWVVRIWRQKPGSWNTRVLHQCTWTILF